MGQVRPAARKGDSTTANVANIGVIGGHLIGGSPDVFINKQPAARVQDAGQYCIAVINQVTEGAQTVFINGKPAAKKTSSMSLSGQVTSGSPDVLLG
ncbi:hypothetical protein PsalN5692_00404 [Piscirickettsia salmonis]|uniref:PAAR domain-containing protein n=1 Tax=Piscirickettsia salmonis TaxID=1238 RepID=UPI0012B73E01|nr:PAAR domain-containing protein [Piscirickettsia salmonis]QGP48989.1 hypothetical protein PsalN5692_00404 [Piscirickettsia salmonis]